MSYHHDTKKYESERTYDGITVTVYANEFDYGPGMPYQPTCIWAVKEDGSQYDLTPEQEAEIADAAVVWAWEYD